MRKEIIGPFGLPYACDVCGKTLLEGQKLGKRKLNDALCHDSCLYYPKRKSTATKKFKKL